MKAHPPARQGHLPLVQIPPTPVQPGLDVPLRWHLSVKCHHWAGGSREEGLGLVQRDKQGGALFWGCPSLLLVT